MDSVTKINVDSYFTKKGCFLYFCKKVLGPNFCLTPRSYSVFRILCLTILYTHHFYIFFYVHLMSKKYNMPCIKCTFWLSTVIYNLKNNTAGVSFFDTKVKKTQRNLNKNLKYYNPLVSGPGWLEK